MSTIQTDTWTISLPDDWEEDQSSNNDQLYFESSDGTKGLYIATWNLGGKELYTPEHAAADFRKTEINALHSMKGYSWEIMEDQLINHINGTAVTIDSFDTHNSYRIFIKILSRPPIVVSVTIHDYLCENILESRMAVSSIIKSLRINNEAAV